MPVITIYRCNKCRKDFDTPKGLWEVTVFARRLDAAGPRWQTSTEVRPGATPVLCTPCAEALSVISPDEDPAEPIPELTIEELIVELVDQRIAEKTGAI